MFQALAHNYDLFPVLNIRLYSHVGALIEVIKWSAEGCFPVTVVSFLGQSLLKLCALSTASLKEGHFPNNGQTKGEMRQRMQS